MAGICLGAVLVGVVVWLIVKVSSGSSPQGTPSSNNRPAFTFRRLCFAAVVIGVMTIAAGSAMGVGYLLVQQKGSGDSALGTVALVVSPALTIIGTLSSILANLLREEKQ